MKAIEEQRERIKKWRKQNPNYFKEYWQKNKQSLQENVRLWTKENIIQYKEYKKKYNKNWHRKNKDEIKIKHAIYWQKNKKRLSTFVKVWMKQNPEYMNEYIQKRIKEDEQFAISRRLRCRLINVKIRYLRDGYIMQFKDGIDYKEIIEYLKPFPKDIKKYHIDHIRPLCSFDLTKNTEIKKAFAPENHQWLLAADNLSKGGKYA